jgi:co-chaperonin GroES (HSP10)
MPNVAMKHEKDPREVILDELGDISGFEIAHNEVLVATYMRPPKTRGGIILTESNLREDEFQSKAGLVVKIGPGCTFKNVSVKLHDWVVVRPSDAWALEVNFVKCRLVYDDQIRARIAHAGMVW